MNGDSRLLSPSGGTATLRPVSRRQQVADLVRNAITSGSLRPGQQLKQDILCAELGVSPGPVREALRQLESEGLVEHLPNRGSYVTDVDPTELLGVLLPVRFTLERYAVEHAISRMTEADYAELAVLITAMNDGALARDLSAINEADMRFHEVIVRASGQRHTIQLWQTVSPRIRATLYRLAPYHQDLTDVGAEHEQLVDVIRTGDLARIEPVLHAHILDSLNSLLHTAENTPAT